MLQLKDGSINGEAGLDTLEVLVVVDKTTMQVLQAFLAYIFNGEYCGDFELNPATFEESYKNKDFTDVINKWDPNSFFYLPFKDCNPLLPEGSDVNIPRCGDYPTIPPIVAPPIPPPT